jgi:hypothetical protein
MNNRDAYQSWLEKRRSVEVAGGFAQRVRQQISRDKEPRRAAMPGRELFQRWLDWVAHHPLVQTALLAVALVAGAARLLATWQVLFSF